SGDTLETDKSHVTTGSIMYDAVFIPGGKHVDTLKKQGDVLHFINEAYKHCKALGFTGEAIRLLQESNVGSGAINFADGDGDDDMGVIIAKEGKGSDDFLEKFKNAILQHRHWS